MKKGLNPNVFMTVMMLLIFLIFIVLLFVNGTGTTQPMIGPFPIILWYLLLSPYLVFVLSIGYYYWIKEYEKQSVDNPMATNHLGKEM